VRRMKKLMTRVLPVLFLPAILAVCSKEEPASLELTALSLEYEASDLERYDKAADFRDRYEALAEEYWGTEAALDAKIWLMSEMPELDDEDAKAATIGEMTDAILEEYAKSPHLGRLADHLDLYTEEQADRYFRNLRENSPHAPVRAAAIFYPAREKFNLLRRGRLEDVPENREAVEADLQLLIDEYGDIPLAGKSYGVAADAVLNPYAPERLAIGQLAPEIVGITADGEEILLSQFKGKVTVFYFWGDW
jgi:hypothetical protein